MGTFYIDFEKKNIGMQQHVKEITTEKKNMQVLS